MKKFIKIAGIVFAIMAGTAAFLTGLCEIVFRVVLKESFIGTLIRDTKRMRKHEDEDDDDVVLIK